MTRLFKIFTKNFYKNNKKIWVFDPNQDQFVKVNVYRGLNEWFKTVLGALLIVILLNTVLTLSHNYHSSKELEKVNFYENYENIEESKIKRT